MFARFAIPAFFLASCAGQLCEPQDPGDGVVTLELSPPQARPGLYRVVARTSGGERACTFDLVEGGGVDYQVDCESWSADARFNKPVSGRRGETGQVSYELQRLQLDEQPGVIELSITRDDTLLVNTRITPAWRVVGRAGDECDASLVADPIAVPISG